MSNVIDYSVEYLRLQSKVLCLVEWQGEICCGCMNGNIYIFHSTETENILTEGIKEPIRSLCVIGENLYSGSSGIENDSISHICVWDSERKCNKIFSENIYGLEHILPWNGKLAIACKDSTLRILDLENGTLQTWFGHHNKVMHQVIWQEYLCTCSMDKTIILWKKDGTVAQRLTGHPAGIMCLAVWGIHLCSGDEGGNILLWEFADMRKLRAFKIGDSQTVSVFNNSLFLTSK
jgi:WD40 repeat protein